jgi:hypothetical protein
MKKEWFFWPLGPIFKRLGHPRMALQAHQYD